jgi:hypothetical protein
MHNEKSVYNFATTRNRKKSRPIDHLDYDTRRAMELGYGCQYGRYKADHPNTRAEYERQTENKPKRTVTRKVLTCKLCGGQFFKRNGSKQLYCSPECKERAHQLTVQASREKKKVPNNTVTTCPICGKEFVTTPKHVKYCSLDCSRQAARENGARLRALNRQEAEKHGND